MKNGSKRVEEKIRGHAENTPFSEVKGKNLSVGIWQLFKLFFHLFFSYLIHYQMNVVSKVIYTIH